MCPPPPLIMLFSYVKCKINKFRKKKLEAQTRKIPRRFKLRSWITGTRPAAAEGASGGKDGFHAQTSRWLAAALLPLCIRLSQRMSRLTD